MVNIDLNTVRVCCSARGGAASRVVHVLSARCSYVMCSWSHVDSCAFAPAACTVSCVVSVLCRVCPRVVRTLSYCFACRKFTSLRITRFN
jgi:hypothetical protein